jgi:hypothetical protein
MPTTPQHLPGFEPPEDPDMLIQRTAEEAAAKHRKATLNREEDCEKCGSLPDDKTMVWNAEVEAFRCYRCGHVDEALTLAARNTL